MKKLPVLHILLFLLTVITTVMAGTAQKGINPFSEPWRLYEGIPFSATLLLILMSHELSHYFASKRHNTEATLPFFIPAPTLIGTFGAVIKMKSPILTRSALVDIGASGPIVGFVVSVAACVWGLFYSNAMASPEPGAGLVLGDSILFYLLSHLVAGSVPEGLDLVLHPVAFAGWIGLFVTSLNLIPVGQLDGGHIAYAFLGPVHRVVSVGLVGVLSVLGMIFWEGWLIWAALLVILGLRHPPIQHWEVPMEPGRKAVGVVSLFIFIITFTPVPFNVL